MDVFEVIWREFFMTVDSSVSVMGGRGVMEVGFLRRKCWLISVRNSVSRGLFCGVEMAVKVFYMSSSQK